MKDETRDVGTRRQRDAETGRRGDAGTRGRGDAETRRCRRCDTVVVDSSPRLAVSPGVSLSPRPHVSCFILHPSSFHIRYNASAFLRSQKTIVAVSSHDESETNQLLNREVDTRDCPGRDDCRRFLHERISSVFSRLGRSDIISNCRLGG